MLLLVVHDEHDYGMLTELPVFLFAAGYITILGWLKERKGYAVGLV